MNALVSYDDSAPLLLVTAFSPDHQGGGGVILRSLVKGSESSVVWASLEPGGAGYAGPTALLRAGRNPWLMPPRLMARRIESLADRHGASAIWAVAHGPIVPCLSVLGESSARSLHLSVHDEPAWGVAFRGRRQRPAAPWIHLHFGRALASATSVDAIGGGMRALIARRAGRDSVIVHRVVDEPVAPHGTEPENDRLTIGLLGSVYSPRQIEQLTAMLARASEILAVPTRLAVIGGAHQRMRHAVRDARVEVDFLGHMAEDEGLEVLRGAFALYIGYPFIRRDRMIRRTSFPAKLATYVQAARPLLVHTPWDSSLTPLFAFQPFTIPWVDEDVRHGARLLASAWRDASLRVSQHEAADAVRRAYFGGDNRERLFDKLNALVT